MSNIKAVAVIPERRFGGKTENFENKEEQRKEQKHLKAYLRGDKTYTHGFFYSDNKTKIPARYDVLEIFT